MQTSILFHLSFNNNHKSIFINNTIENIYFCIYRIKNNNKICKSQFFKTQYYDLIMYEFIKESQTVNVY